MERTRWEPVMRKALSPCCKKYQVESPVAAGWVPPS